MLRPFGNWATVTILWKFDKTDLQRVLHPNIDTVKGSQGREERAGGEAEDLDFVHRNSVLKQGSASNFTPLYDLRTCHLLT